MTIEEENVIKKYDDQLNQYFKIAYPGFTKLINEERAPYMKQIDALSELYWFFNYLLDYKSDMFKQDNHKPLALFYTKAASDLISVRQCLMIGQLLSAISIERNIFETFVDLSLVLQSNTDERLSLYNDYQKVLIWLRLTEYSEYIKELESNNEINEEIVKKEKERFDEYYNSGTAQSIVEQYESVRINYHPNVPYHWAWKIFKDARGGRNPSIRSICKAINLYDDYLHVYSANSIAVHNQPLIVNFLTREGGLTSIPSFTKNTNSTAALTMSFALEIMVRILTYIHFPEIDEITFFLDAVYKKTFYE